jgi:hypothetical protein
VCALFFVPGAVLVSSHAPYVRRVPDFDHAALRKAASALVDTVGHPDSTRVIWWRRLKKSPPHASISSFTEAETSALKTLERLSNGQEHWRDLSADPAQFRCLEKRAPPELITTVIRALAPLQVYRVPAGTGSILFMRPHWTDLAPALTFFFAVAVQVQLMTKAVVKPKGNRIARTVLFMNIGFAGLGLFGFLLSLFTASRNVPYLVTMLGALLPSAALSLSILFRNGSVWPKNSVLDELEDTHWFKQRPALRDAPLV